MSVYIKTCDAMARILYYARVLILYAASGIRMTYRLYIVYSDHPQSDFIPIYI